MENLLPPLLFVFLKQLATLLFCLLLVVAGIFCWFTCLAFKKFVWVLCFVSFFEEKT